MLEYLAAYLQSSFAINAFERSASPQGPIRPNDGFTDITDHRYGSAAYLVSQIAKTKRGMNERVPALRGRR